MLTFTRVDTQYIDELMNEPELALGLIQDMGFSVEDDLDNDSILNLLEERWKGEAQTFSIEQYQDIAQLVLLDIEPHETMALLFSGGKTSTIISEGKALRVLSPAEVQRIQDVFSTLDLMQLQHEWMSVEKVKPVYPNATTADVDTFWMLFPGLFHFISKAAKLQQCVIIAQQKLDSSTA